MRKRPDFLVFWKAWKVFLTFLILSFLPGTFYFFNFYSFLVYKQLSMFNAIFVLIWLYTVGIKLHQKLPAGVSSNLTVFRILIYIGVILLFVWPLFSSFKNALFIILINIILFYSFFFVAKALVSIEKKSVAVFSDFVGSIVYMLVFPLGIWFLQPRIQVIFEDEIK